MTREHEIADGLTQVRARIDAARLASRRADEVLLVVVTKTFPASDIAILADLGVSDIAENRDQEARAKRAELGATGDRLRWHMIGQVQRNKAGSVARWADVVESVDRPELVDALARGAHAAGRTLEALVQVGLDPVHRPERGGVAPGQAAALADLVAQSAGLRLGGVMGVAPHPGDPDAAFALLERTWQGIRHAHPLAEAMSAGMSDDLEAAIAHGATQVRIGGAVLGHRAYVQ